MVEVNKPGQMWIAKSVSKGDISGGTEGPMDVSPMVTNHRSQKKSFHNMS